MKATRVILFAILVFLIGAVSAAADLNDGLVAYYPFNGNADDESENGNNGTVNNTTLTTDRFGRTDRAYSFNGTDSYINCGNDSSVAVTGALTVSAWVKPIVFDGGRIVSKRGGSLTGYGLMIDSLNNLRFSLGNTTVVSKSVAGMEGPWMFVTATYEETSPSHTVKIFVNKDEPLTTTTSRTLEADSEVLKIGALWITPTVSSSFNGTIDEVRIYNRTLSENEIRQIYNEGRAGPAIPALLLDEP